MHSQARNGADDDELVIRDVGQEEHIVHQIRNEGNTTLVTPAGTNLEWERINGLCGMGLNYYVE